MNTPVYYWMKTLQMTHNTFTLGLLAAHPQYAARTLEAATPEELATFLVGLPETIAAAVVRELSPALAAASLSMLDAREVAAVFQHIDIDVAAMILRRLNKEQRHDVVSHLPASNWVGLRMVLRYPEDTVGSVMDPNVLSVHEEMPIGNVLKNMRLFKNQLLHVVYVTDRNHALAGALDVRELFFAREQQFAGELTHHIDSIVTARTTLSSMYNDDVWLGQSELPIVDHNQRFLGVLHRNSLTKALDYLSLKTNSAAGLTETALALSELLWSACAGIFSGSVKQLPPDNDKRENNDGQ